MHYYYLLLTTVLFTNLFLHARLLLVSINCIVCLQTVPGTYWRRKLHWYLAGRVQVVDWRTGQHSEVVGSARRPPIAAARLHVTDLLTGLLSDRRVAGCRVSWVSSLNRLRVSWSLTSDSTQLRLVQCQRAQPVSRTVCLSSQPVFVSSFVH